MFRRPPRRSRRPPTRRTRRSTRLRLFGRVARSGTAAEPSPSSCGGISSAKDGECGASISFRMKSESGVALDAGAPPAPGVESAASIWFR